MTLLPSMPMGGMVRGRISRDLMVIAQLGEGRYFPLFFFLLFTSLGGLWAQPRWLWAWGLAAAPCVAYVVRKCGGRDSTCHTDSGSHSGGAGGRVTQLE